MRYKVFPIDSPDGDSINEDVFLGSSDNVQDACNIAARSIQPFGAAVVDTRSGKIDFGFGFGEPMPTDPGGRNTVGSTAKQRREGP